MSDFLRQQTLALLGQEFLSQALSNGGSLNSVVTDILLHPKPGNGREIAAAALTGRIRSDSAMLRQGARNASEGATMADMIKTATASMGETMTQMQDIVQKVRDGAMTAADATPVFKSLASQLTATIQGTQYNGISLLDKNGWQGDERLTVSGDTATLPIQVGNAASTFSLRDLSALSRFENSNLGNAGGLASLVNTLGKELASLDTMSSGYASLAGTYTGEAKYLEQQADTLALAAQKAQPGGSLFADMGDQESTLQSLLMDLILRDYGKVVDTSS